MRRALALALVAAGAAGTVAAVQAEVSATARGGADPAPGDAAPRAPGDPAVPPDPIDHVGEGVLLGSHTRLETTEGPVHVWAPRGYDPATAITVVYVHGYWVDVDEAWWGHGLPEQFGLAQINALFIACEAPLDAADPVRWTSLAELLGEVTAAGIDVPRGAVAVIGHSGAYRTLEPWAREGRLDTLVLLDAAYGPLHWLAAWTRGGRGRRLINVGDDTRPFTDLLHRYVVAPSVTLRDFADFQAPGAAARLARHRVIYVRSTLGHYPLVSGGVALPAVLRALGAPPVSAPPLDPDALATAE
jgi:hypothetical protein